MTLQLLAFVLYLCLMLGIGIYFFIKSNKAKENGDKEYFLGGRQMGPYVTAMSAQASDMSGWLLMGFPGSIMAFGFGQIWIGIGLALGTIANWIFVARRLRKFSEAANDSITLPQYLTNRFATKNKALQIICAIIFLVFFTLYVASSFNAGAQVLLDVVPQLNGNMSLAVLIFAVIIIVYTFFGGFKAVCWTDFFQGLMMLIAIMAVPIVLLATKNVDTSILSVPVGDYTFATTPFSVKWQEIASGLAWGLGYFGMPHILVRFMSIKKPSMMKKSATVAIIWVILSLGAATVIGIVGRMIVDPQFLLDGKQENIFIHLVNMVFDKGVLLFIGGILLSAIVAAAMSTADSQLLVASSSFTSDIYKPIFRKKASDKEILWVGRIVVLVVAVVAYFIASSTSEGASSIMDMVGNAWGGFGSAFGGVILLSIFWKRLTYKGAVAGVIAGAVVDVVWLIWLTGPTGVYELLPGFFAGLIFAIVVSLIDKKPSPEVLKIYKKATYKSIND